MTDEKKAAVVLKVHQALLEMAEIFKDDAVLRSWALYRAADLTLQTGVDPRDFGRPNHPGEKARG